MKEVDIRRKAIEELTNTNLKGIGDFSISPDSADGNIENMIGAVQVPIGIAGPLKVNGELAKGEYYIPLATTEGALVASVNRGCSVITASKGANTWVFKDKMTRAPAIRTKGIAETKLLLDWIKLNFEQIKQKAEKTTLFGKLIQIVPHIAGNTIFLRFEYTTGDAMGMNMVTIATDEAVKLIAEKTNTELIALSGNMCADKKPAWLNSIEGRGKSVVVEVIIPEKLVKSKLKTTPSSFIEVVHRKISIGSALAGSLGFNAHVANVIAGIFIATGQDAAHVVEASNAITTAEIVQGNKLYVSVTLPSLLVGTIGGGTGLKTQNECLNILGVAGGADFPGENAKKFAEIVAAAVLAGEISLIAALSTGDLAKAHQRLART
ncbi:hydroxymethylglutaryl-CoA reductase (NADPH) [Candidatus Parcubacteria bacterium]|nr:hydroxymethylglutaryl-CoA reductase (NADPH) [Candidatus Parcubacteria bacterium]